MDINQLKAFIAVAQELSFSRAAKNLHMTQPPVSRMIKTLERNLSVELFRRNTRNVELTIAGEAFLNYAINAIDTIEKGETLLKQIKSGKSGQITLGFYSSASHPVITKIAQLAKQEMPEIVIRYETTSHPTSTLSRIIEGSIDAALVRSRTVPPTINSLRIISEKPVVLMEANHRLARFERIPIDELRDERMVALPASTEATTRHLLFEWCFAAGFAPNIVQEAPDSLLISALVSAGVGLNVTYDSVCNYLHNPQLTYRELEVENFESTLQFAWPNSPRNPAIAKLVEIAHTIANEAKDDAQS